MRDIERNMTKHNNKLFKLTKTSGNTNENNEAMKDVIEEVNKHFRNIIQYNTEVIDKNKLRVIVKDGKGK
jgi:hypothetical protein